MSVSLIDIANFTAVPTPEQLALMKSLGLTTLIVGASYGIVARNQIIAGQAAKLNTEAYAFIEFSDNWKAPLDRALNAIAGLGIERLWLDLELQANGYTPDEICARIREATDYVESIAPSIQVGYYSAAWWWNANCAGIAADDVYARPLWFARYGSPERGWENDFGGWTAEHVIYHQYAGSVTYIGLNVDLNTILWEDNMADYYTKSEADATTGALLRLGIAQGEQIKALATAFADHVKNHSDSNNSPQAVASQKMVDDLTAAQKEINDRIIAAAAILGHPIQEPGLEGNHPDTIAAKAATADPGLPPNPAAPILNV